MIYPGSELLLYVISVSAGLVVQGILLAVLIPLSIIVTAVLTLLLVFCFSLRKASQLRAQNTQRQVAEKTDGVKKQHSDCETVRSSNHIYSLPEQYRGRNSNNSMLYNMAYQQGFTMSSNAAYSSSLKV